MPPEMFIGLSLSGLLILMSGKSPAPKSEKPEKKTVVTFILPDCDDGGTFIGKTQSATFEKR
ncbi:hypothetical protein [Leptothoe sp. PORK10 BA2]|uniref:hypothetical protein n=1 Tax=Leptothoe sp. PORK10 BA2 TaxID=3110254 RepID=UPI002B1F5DF5|nr:hypothetical protein [Leptothoe sp. PORK10 BA2]MEA5467058.1 hypothetical protein [Leptothoe sp. PORK10 BA2]